MFENNETSDIQVDYTQNSAVSTKLIPDVRLQLN